MSRPLSCCLWRSKRASRSGGAIRLGAASSPLATDLKLCIIKVWLSNNNRLNAASSEIVAAVPPLNVLRNLVTCSSVATVPGDVKAKLSLAKVANWLLRNASIQGCVKPASSACCTNVASESKMEEAAIAIQQHVNREESLLSNLAPNPVV